MNTFAKGITLAGGLACIMLGGEQPEPVVIYMPMPAVTFTAAVTGAFAPASQVTPPSAGSGAASGSWSGSS